VNPDSSAHSAELSITRQPIEDTRLSSGASVAYNDSGDSAENTSRSFERPCYAQSKSDVRVEFTPWRLLQSQFRSRQSERH
jgi:hypothetical protein